MRDRFVSVGILCLAVSLAIKPQDPGLVWLYFLLAGGLYRKRALQTLLVVIAIALPCILWVWSVAPGWVQELRSNLLAFAVHGGLNDPGPASNFSHTFIDLQVVLSRFKDDPSFYNPVSYLIVALPLLVWMLVTLRSRFSQKRAMLAIAAVTALSMLPVHHHFYDTKLLLLTVPALAILWTENGRLKWLSLIVSTTGYVLTGDISETILFHLTNRLLPDSTVTEQAWRAILVSPAPLILLIMGLFYLAVYAREAFRPVSPEKNLLDRFSLAVK
jgi:hypothetical protein